MPTIIKGNSTDLALAVLKDGKPFAIDEASTVQAQLFTLAGEQLSDEVSCSNAAPGANWAGGVVAASFDATVTDALPLGQIMIVIAASGATSLVKRFLAQVESISSPVKSSLFVRDFVIDELRSDGLVGSVVSLIGNQPSDDYLWGKILAAEAAIKRELRVPLVPTKFFPGVPTQEQLDALDGMPWEVDPGYDYHQDMFFPDQWGFIKLKNKPVIDIEAVDFDFPSMGDTFFKMPTEWIRMDKKYATVQFVPSTPALFSTAGTFIMKALTGYNSVPLMIKLTYTAGLQNVEQDYPDLLDAIKKMAVLKVIEASFPAQSGSISADGLSQSMSVDVDKYHSSINTILHGDSGSNGGLMAAIHGIRTIVM